VVAFSKIKIYIHIDYTYQRVFFRNIIIENKILIFIKILHIFLNIT